MFRIKNVCLLFAVFCGMLLFVQCKPGIPDKYLQPAEMADILYEYHLAEGIANGSMQDTRDTIALRTFRQNILGRYGVSQAEFDSSLVYYTRHTKLLEDVYTKLVDRFNSESTALGGASVQFGGDIAGSDTTNLWRQAASFVLSPYIATNRLTFEVKADTSFHAGDKFMLDFDANFIYQDGMRDALALLAVTYDNDSTEYVTNSVMSSTHYHLQIGNAGKLKVKLVRGFLLLSNGGTAQAASSTTLKQLVVCNMKLIRMHTNDAVDAADAGSAADSLKGRHGDSLQNASTGINAGTPAQRIDAKPQKIGGLKPVNAANLKRLNPGQAAVLKPMDDKALKIQK